MGYVLLCVLCVVRAALFVVRVQRARRGGVCCCVCRNLPPCVQCVCRAVVLPVCPCVKVTDTTMGLQDGWEQHRVGQCVHVLWHHQRGFRSVGPLPQLPDALTDRPGGASGTVRHCRVARLSCQHV